MTTSTQSIPFMLDDAKAALGRLREAAGEHPATRYQLEKLEQQPNFGTLCFRFDWDPNTGWFRATTTPYFDSVLAAAKRHDIRELFDFRMQARQAFKKDRRAAL